MLSFKRWILLLGTLIAGHSLHAASKPDVMWTYKTVDGKALKMAVFLPQGYEASAAPFPTFVVYPWRKLG